MSNLALHRLLGVALLTLVPITAHAQQAAQAAPLRGDVNGDGRVTAADAQAVRDHVAGRPAAAGIQLLPNGDANGDGRITGVDAAMIQAFAAGRDVSRFGVGQPIAGGTGGGEGKKGENLIGLYVCTVDLEAGTQKCETPRPGMGASADVLLGRPAISYVTTGTVHSRADLANEDTTSMNVAVTNNIGQPIGTINGTTAAASGIRVFFNDGPRVTAVRSGTLASATIRLEGTDGTADFAGPEGEGAKTNRLFYQYNSMVAPNATSPSKGWKFIFSSNTKSYVYTVLASAPVQYEFGMVSIAPASLVLGEGEASAALTPTARDVTFATVPDGINWSSSDPAVATVDASGVVTGVAEGTATITATSTVKAQRTGTIPVTVDKAPTVVSHVPADGATDVASTSNIQITFSEAVDVTTASFTLECPTGSAKTFTVSGSGTAVVTLDPDADLPAATTCTVKVIGSQVSDSDTNDGPNNLAGGDRTFSFEVAITAVPDVFGTTTTGNVRINSASTTPAFSVTANDEINAATTVTFAGWNGTAGKTQNGGDVTMTASGEGMGQFTYNPPAGFEGTDSLEYTVTSGSASSSAKVALPVSGMIWFVNNAGTACTSRANGCGRLTNPYSTLAAFQAENNGTGNNPAANDAIFVYQSATAYTGPVTLLNGQKLIGQDATGTLQALSGITPAAGSDALPDMDTGGAAATIAGADAVNLGSGNMLRGLTLAPTAGEAISGTGFGTLTLSTGTADLTINAAGQALSLTTGAITGTFTSVASAGGTNNVLLSGVTGDIDFGAGALSGSTGGAIKIVGGALTLDASGNITQATAFPLLDVSGTHTGALTFTGTLSATAGTGLQFSDADGSYSFGGTTTLNGGDAGIDIIGGSGGTFTFGSNTAVTNPTGAAFRVAASAPAVTYNGNLTKSGTSAGLLVDISDQASGTITFASGTLAATSSSATSTGIQLSNADGTVNFNGTTTLNGGDAGIDIIGGSGGTITFASGTAVTNPSGTAFRVASSTPGVAFNGSLTKNGTSPGLLVDISGQASGTITFANGTLSNTSTAGTGIQLSDADGTVSFNGTTTLSNGDNGVDVIGGSTGAISFASTSSITNPSGIALRVFNGTANANVTFAGNISTNAGRPVHVEGVSGGTVNVTGTIAATGQGLLAQNNTGGTFSFTNATKTFNTAANAAVTLTSNTGATISFTNGLAITTTSGAGINATGGGNLTVNTGVNTISSGTGTALTVSSTTIAAGGLNFRSITANGGANGIFLDNTGSTAGLTVAGNGAAGTGGTIQNTTGGDGTTSGIGIYLNSTVAPSFSWMQLNDHAGHAIKGTSVTGFTMVKTRITGSNGSNESGPYYEGSISFTNLTGSASITGSNVSGGRLENLRVINTAGTLDRLVMDGDTIGHNGTLGGQSVLLEPQGAAVMKVTVQNSRFTGARDQLFQLNQIGTGANDLVFTGNALSNSHANSLAGGVLITGGGTGSNPTLTYNVSNNTFQGAKTSALVITKPNSTGSYVGTVSGNTIGIAGTANSGSTGGNGIRIIWAIQGTHTVAITNNQIRQYNSEGGILLQAGGVAATGVPHNATLNATITGNTIAEPGTLSAIGMNGIHLNSGTNSGDAYQVCLSLNNNTVANSGKDNASGVGQDYMLRERQATTVRLPGYPGPSNGSALETYLTPRTNGSFTLFSQANVNGFQNTAGSAACPAP
jgi:hypothetical protein